MKRKICFITGTRADYGILYSVMKAVQQSPALDLQIVVTCMHLMPEFGYTVKEIEKDGFPISDKVDVAYSDDTGKAMVASVGRTIEKLAESLVRLAPDILVVLGEL